MESTSDCLIRLAREIEEPCDTNKLLRISRERCPDGRSSSMYTYQHKRRKIRAERLLFW